jgi:putative ABC transport system substrate-binding protein
VRRREFIKLLGIWTAGWPRAGYGQQVGKSPIIGILGSGTPASQGQWYAGFVRRLRELGWTEGQNVAVEYRWADGRDERFAEIAAELVRLKVNVIVTSGHSAILAAKRATSSIPIVFALAGDAVGTGLIESLARPGGNITGLSLQQTDTSAKRLELLREVLPDLRRLAIMGNANAAGAVLEMREVQDAARKLGLDVVRSEIRRVDDIAPAIELLKGSVQALYVVSDILVYVERMRIHSLVLAAKLPTMHGFREYVEAGGLLSYAANPIDQFRRAAGYVDKILRGAQPADLPVEQPTKFDLVINLITAKALGLTIPPMLLARADEVIE